MEKKELSTGELIRCARECIGKGDCLQCDFCDDDSCTNSLILTLADKLEEALGKNGINGGIEWIPSKFAKPLEADEYLVMIVGSEKPTTLWYDPDEEAFYEEGFCGEGIWYPVTHWAELPEGPNETSPCGFYTSSTANAVPLPLKGKPIGSERKGEEVRDVQARGQNGRGGAVFGVREAA